MIAWAKENKVWVLSDLAYSELYYDGNPTPSIMQVPGAKDVAVEFTSLSKTYSMAGWRIGFAVGNERLISALTRVKSYLDYGAFTPVQVAAAGHRIGLRHRGEFDRDVHRARHLQHRRRRIVIEIELGIGEVGQHDQAVLLREGDEVAIEIEIGR